MINITPICKHYNKLASSFLSKKICRGRTDIAVHQGHTGGTKIPNDMVKEFFMWVSPVTRNMILSGVTAKEVYEIVYREIK